MRAQGRRPTASGASGTDGIRGRFFFPSRLVMPILLRLFAPVRKCGQSGGSDGLVSAEGSQAHGFRDRPVVKGPGNLGTKLGKKFLHYLVEELFGRCKSYKSSVLQRFYLCY